MWIGQYIVPAVQYSIYETLHIAVVYITAQNLQKPTINLCYVFWI